jgi:hypothetical protein
MKMIVITKQNFPTLSEDRRSWIVKKEKCCITPWNFGFSLAPTGLELSEGEVRKGGPRLRVKGNKPEPVKSF